ncbi:MAG: YibE/F family protein, partial [Oscillospiraceae bacterium]
GGLKGMWSLVALGLTCAAVFLVFIPAVLAGKNIYFWACAVCLYSIMGTLLLVSGASKKSFAAGVGCAAGVGVAGILTLLMTRVLLLTGFVDEQSVYLLSMGNGVEIDLKGVIFAGILIGALGAVMDVAMSIASALEELAVRTEHPTFSSLLRSGLTIGRDIMGTMANTLVLAYIGSSLSVVLLLIAYASSALGMLNREMMVVEMLQALVGSIGILCAIPLTSLICAAIYPAAAERPIAEGIQPPMAVSEETAGGSR